MRTVGIAVASGLLALASCGCGGGASSSTPATARATPPIPNATVVGGPAEVQIATPSSVLKAGVRELREYEAGRRAVAASGCLACHRIGANGNDGPGPDLTEIAGRLPKRAIARTLVNPTEPMPSFRHLPSQKFRAIVSFLAQLK